MGIILAKFRKEKSTQEVLEALQEKIDTLETFTVNTEEQKKRIVGNFLAVSIGVYVIAFVLFYFAYFPPTWKERFVYFIPLLLFPLIIIQLRYLFTWYFQRKLNKNSKKLTVLRAEKKKILEQVMDKETYKVAVNLLARFADKPSKTAIVLSSATPTKPNQPSLNRSLHAPNQRSQQLALTPSPRTSSTFLNTSTPRLMTQLGSSSPGPSLLAHNNSLGQHLRRRTPFPIVNQQEKGVFDRIVDVLIGDGPQDRFAMICKECFSHNGMALKEDFEYTTFRCAFCSALNPARKSRPVAPRLSLLPAPAPTAALADSDQYDSEDDKADYEERFENLNPTELVNNEIENTGAVPLLSSPSDEESSDEKRKPQSGELNEASKGDLIENSLNELLKQLEKSDSAIEDKTIVPNK